MTALIVIWCIILLIIILLSFSLRIRIKLHDGAVDFKVKYMFFKLYPIKRKKSKTVKAKKKRKTDKKAKPHALLAGDTEHEQTLGGDATAQEKGGSGFSELTKSIGSIIKYKDKISAYFDDPKIKKILKKSQSAVIVDGMTLDFTVCGADAYDAAINYGWVNAVTYNAISAVRLILPISVKSVDIICDFDSKKSIYNGSADIKLRLPKLISAGTLLLIWFIKNKNDLLNRKEE